MPVYYCSAADTTSIDGVQEQRPRRQRLDEYTRDLSPGSTVIFDEVETRRLIGAPIRHGWRLVPVDGGHVVVATVETIDWARFPLRPAADQESWGGPADVPGQLVRVLTAWRAVVGAPWVGTPGMTGLSSMTVGESPIRAVLRSGTPSPNAREWMEAPLTRSSWHRTGDTAISVDSNRRYLAAMSSVLLGRGAPVRVGRVEFDRRRAGWWLVDVPEWTHEHLPPPAGPPGRRWVTTPTLTLLRELHTKGFGPRVTPVDAMVTHGARVLRDWAGRVEAAWMYRGALTRHPDARRRLSVSEADAHGQALKSVYREAFGMLGRVRSPIYRPDWHAAIIAQARATMFRTAMHALVEHGRRPLWVDVDAIGYSEADPPRSIRIGEALGEWKLRGVAPR